MSSEKSQGRRLISSYRFNSIDDVIVAEAYRHGLSLAHISEVIGCSTPTVRKALCRRQVPTRRSGRASVPLPVQRRIARMYQEGWLQRELASHFHYAITTVRSALRQQSVTIRHHNVAEYEPTPEQIEAAAAEIRNGWSEELRRKRAGIVTDSMTIPLVYDLPQAEFSASST